MTGSMKKNKEKKEIAKKAKGAKITIAPEMKDDPFDFGGLPKRDLKKNLGCG
jgi:hypothetical protein